MNYRLIIPGLLCACVFAAGQLPAASASMSGAKPSSLQRVHPFFDAGATPAWSRLTPQQAEIDIRLALKLAQERIDAIAAVEEPTYDNTFGALQRFDSELDAATSLFSHLSSIKDSPEQRAAEQKLMPEVAAFQSSMMLNERLWKVLQKAAGQPWARDLDGEKKRFVEVTMDAFRASGADLPADKKARLAEIHHELEVLTQKYSQNLLDATNAWQLVLKDKNEIAGMPESWLSSARQQALDKGIGTESDPRWLVTLQYTSYGPVMKYNENEAVRKKVFEGMESVGAVAPYDNEQLVRRIITLRREMASILGFATYADLTTHNRMAGSGERAMNFIGELHNKVSPAFRKEVEDLLAYIGKKTGKPTKAIDPWSRAFWIEKLRAEQYNFDSELLRPYFEANRVFKGLFAIYSTLYDVRIIERPTYCGEVPPASEEMRNAVEVWHPEVRFFEIREPRGGELLGSFYMDWFPRETKRSGAWMIPLHIGHAPDGNEPRVPHVAAICGNLTPATGDRPALFAHYDVEVVYHEFGHLMHVMLSDTKIKALGGTNVAWDFVELPSQINENWTWEPKAVKLFAQHYETGDTMPSELLGKLISSRNFMAASTFMGQLSIGKIDLEMYMNYDRYKNLSLDEAEQTILKGYLPPYSVPRKALIYNLPHIISGGYSAGYYSYKWAEALAADAFTRFKKEGLFNPETGRAFRNEILSKGNTQPAVDLFRNFMGRDLDPNALLISNGIMPPAAKK